MTTIVPSTDKVLVRPTKASGLTPGGIALVTQADDQIQEGRIIAVGPGRVLDSGAVVAPIVRAGNTVIFAKYGGVPLKVDGEEHLILDVSNILAAKIVMPDLPSEGIRDSGP